MKKLWEIREFSTVVILVLEILFFTWWLWPEGGRSHPFLNTANALLILKYSSIYGIAAVGAAIVIISGGIDLAPGAVMALAGVVGAQLYVVQGWGLGSSMTMGVPSAAVEKAYRALLTQVPTGFTFVALHCNIPGEIESIVPGRAHWRTDEYRLFASGEPQRWLDATGIARVGYRKLRELYRSATAA